MEAFDTAQRLKNSVAQRLASATRYCTRASSLQQLVLGGFPWAGKSWPDNTTASASLGRSRSHSW